MIRVGRIVTKMLSNFDNPKTYLDLSKRINQHKPKKFKVIEIVDRKDKTLINKSFDEFIRKGNFSVVFIGD